MALDYHFHAMTPNLKKDIPEEEGTTIADPMLVLRGIITTDAAEATFDVYTPPISGMLERIVVIPDHNNQPGNAGTINFYAFQENVEAPLITVPIMAAAYADPLDILNGQGVGVSNAAITHLHTQDVPGTNHPVFKQLLVNDRLRIRFTNWSDGVAVADRNLYIYFYFTSGTGAGSSGGGPGPAGDVEFVQLYGTTTLALTGANPTQAANIALAPVSGGAKIKRIVVVVTTPNVGTAYNNDSRTFEIRDINVASGGAIDGINTIYYEEELNPDTHNKLINKTDHMLGEILFQNVAAGQVGVISVRALAVGGDGTSAETWTVRVYGESMDI